MPLCQTQIKQSTQTRFPLLQDYSFPLAWRSINVSPWLCLLARGGGGVQQLLRGILVIDVYRKAWCPEDGAKHCHLLLSNPWTLGSLPSSITLLFLYSHPPAPSHSSVSIPWSLPPSRKDSGSHWTSLEVCFNPRVEYPWKINSLTA